MIFFLLPFLFIFYMLHKIVLESHHQVAYRKSASLPVYYNTSIRRSLWEWFFHLHPNIPNKNTIAKLIIIHFKMPHKHKNSICYNLKNKARKIIRQNSNSCTNITIFFLILTSVKPLNSINVPKCHERWHEWRIGVGAL